MEEQRDAALEAARELWVALEAKQAELEGTAAALRSAQARADDCRKQLHGLIGKVSGAERLISEAMRRRSDSDVDELIEGSEQT